MGSKMVDLQHSKVLIALHRYYIWANRLREHFDSVAAAVFADDPGLFLSYWYAALFVVVEGWRDLELKDQQIDQLLQSPHVDLLRRYRNGVCHFQRDYCDPRFLDLVGAKGAVPWVRELNLALGRYFLEKTNSSKPVVAD